MEATHQPPGHEHALLNLGCGRDVHPAFVNIDLFDGPGIIQRDLREGIPFSDATFDLVYHSTMLTMMRPPDALKLMGECRRVLKPGKVLRIVTEDLRADVPDISTETGGSLRRRCPERRGLRLDDPGALLQATREWHGGEMIPHLSRDPLPNEAFVYSRIGDPGRRIVAALRARSDSQGKSSPAGTSDLRTRLVARVRKMVLTALLGSKGPKAVEIGRFRLASGQVSYRMYDRYSLGRLFRAAGFSRVSPRKPTESGYAFWESVNLDVSKEGEAARPHTLIMEGTHEENPVPVV